MRTAAWWVAVVAVTGCSCGVARDLETTASNQVYREFVPRKPRDAGPPLTFPAPPPCVTTTDVADGGSCAAPRSFLFDGQACRPSCLPPVTDGGGLYADESRCLLSCRCAPEKVESLDPAPFDSNLRCSWLYVSGRDDAGVLDGDNCRTRDSGVSTCMWTFPLSPTDAGFQVGYPLGTEGVRFVCDWSLLPQVSSVYCEVWSE